MRLALLVCFLMSSTFVQAVASPEQNSTEVGVGMPLTTLVKKYANNRNEINTLRANISPEKKLSKKEAIQLVSNLPYPIVALNQAFLDRNPYWPVKVSQPFPNDFHECYKSKFNDSTYNSYRSGKIAEAFEKGHVENLINQINFLENKHMFSFLKRIYVEANHSVFNFLDILANPSPDLLAEMKKDFPNTTSFKLEDELDLFNAETTVSSATLKAFDNPNLMVSNELSDQAMLLMNISHSPEFEELSEILVLSNRGVARELNTFNTYIFSQCESARVN